MQRALLLAAKGQYSAKPNPCVGCVIVKNGLIVGEGWHQKAGEPHAEVNALAQVGDQAEGATAYVTLEPCSHFGKTPPCKDALIGAKVSRVVVAMEDPNPLVSGNGIDALRAAGITVEVGLLNEQAEALNVGFCHRMKTGKPFVFSKIAMSMDGRTAMASGESKWITGAESRLDVHHLRGICDAVLTGVGTVIADDPQMNARDGMDSSVKQPLRLVVDSQLNTPANAVILGADKNCVIFYSQQGLSQQLERKAALEKAGFTLVCLPAIKERVDLNAVFSWLAEQNINSVMVEAGSTLNGALISERLIDELVIYMAPCVMGSDAKGAFTLPSLKKMADRKQLLLQSTTMQGNDLRLDYRILKS